MWPENIISIPIHDHCRCIYHAPTVLLKAMELEFRPVEVSTNRLGACGILKHWHKDAYEFNDAVLYGDVCFSDIAYHYSHAISFNHTKTAPVILVDNSLVDGAHRLLNALLNNIKSIDAIALSWENFEYILSEIEPVYKELKNMPNYTGSVLAINTVTKEIDMKPADNMPNGWITDIPDVKLLPYVDYVSGKWVPNRDTLMPELHAYLRLQCRTLSKEPISYLGNTFYFGKYELTSMLSELAVSKETDIVSIPDHNDRLVSMPVYKLKSLIEMYNSRKRQLCEKMTSVIDKAQTLGDDDLLVYCKDIFNKPFGD